MDGELASGSIAVGTGVLDPAPARIAVLQAKAVGDFLVTLPALTALKDRYPEAELVLLGRPWVRDFLAGRPGPVDRVLVVPPFPGVRDAAGPADLTEIEAFVAAARDHRFDLALHLQGNGGATNPLLHRLAAGLTVGMADAGTAPLDRSIPYVHYANEVLRNLEIVGLVGARPVVLEPRLPVLAADLAESRSVVSGDAPFVVLHPGADDPRRRWPPGKFAEAGDALVDIGYRAVITGTPPEAEVVDAVRQRMRNPATPVLQLSLGGLAGLLSRSRLLISNDTGPLHLARAVGAPTVGILWAPNVLNWGPLTRRTHRVAIAWTLECPACGVRPVDPWPFQPVTAECDHPFSFVSEVTVREVLGSALALLPGY